MTFLVALTALALHAPDGVAQGRLAALGSQLQMGMFSPIGDAPAERARAPLGLRYIYVTSGVGDGRLHAPDAPGGRWLADWLRESNTEHMVPVLTYYQLQPSATSGSGELGRVAAILRQRTAMRRYWQDVRQVLKVAGSDPSQLVVLHVEPDAWEYLDQLRGVRTPAAVASTGLPELHGLPNDARGFARAFVRLRDRYAPNVALGWHLSSWGVGQVNPGSVENSAEIARLRAAFYRALGARFDLVLEDPHDVAFDAGSWAEHISLLRTFHDDVGLPLVLFQVSAPAHAAWLLGADAASRTHLTAARDAGVAGILWDAGTPDSPKARDALLARTSSYFAHGALGLDLDLGL